MTSKAAPEPEEWVSVTRESEDGGLAKRDMQDVTLNDDVEAAPAPSTTTTPSGGGAALRRQGRGRKVGRLGRLRRHH